MSVAPRGRDTAGLCAMPWGDTACWLGVCRIVEHGQVDSFAAVPMVVLNAHAGALRRHSAGDARPTAQRAEADPTQDEAKRL